MQSMLPIVIPQLSRPIAYTDNILLIGSCFTEHISDRLQQHKFNVLPNQHGILFNPLSVAMSLNSYIDEKQYDPSDLFFLNELWNSWDHHTRFSDINKNIALAGINRSQADAAKFIKEADWVIITLGSSFQYYLLETGMPVANNHRAPAQWFEKRLLSIESITEALTVSLNKLFTASPTCNVLFTISPVRHIRDGVTENNRSKARLVEAVHTICEKNDRVYYFPAYELLIDVLRDYRYYDIDLVHPNYAATSHVWERFIQSCIAPSAHKIMQEVQEVMTARAHRPRFPQTEAHRKFKKGYAERVAVLMKTYPFLDLKSELNYFSE